MSLTKEAFVAHAPAAVLPRQHPRASVRRAVPGDAGQIATVYDEVYRGTYSYEEFVDPASLAKDISGRWNGWYVIEDEGAGAGASVDAGAGAVAPAIPATAYLPAGETTTGTARGLPVSGAITACNGRGGTVCGCVSGALDPVHGRVYVRGMMVRPAWQGRGGTSLAMGQAFVDFMGTFGTRSRVVWSETRGAEKRALAVCETTGLVPLGILPGKDFFFRRRETAVLMALYSSTAWRTRDPAVAIIPEIVPAREHASAMLRPLRKDDVRIVDVPSTTAPSSSPYIDITSVPRPHGYVAHAFTCTATGEAIEIVENVPNRNAEHMAIHCASQATARALLSACKAFLQARGVLYVEGASPASRPWLQRAFVDAGFPPRGYLPAWTKDPRTGLHRDEVVFAWHADPFDPASIDPTSKAARLVHVLFE